MVLLREKKVLNFVWDSVIGVISKVWAWFIGAGVGGRALPARDIDAVQVLGHHGYFNRVKGTKCCGCGAVGLVGFESSPKLFGQLVGAIAVSKVTS